MARPGNPPKFERLDRRFFERIREHLTDEGRLILNIFDLRFHTVAEHATTLGAALKKQLKEP